MKILFVTHLYPPDRLSGSEIYAHTLLKYFQSKGHECRVLLYPHNGYLPKNIYEYDGIEIFAVFCGEENLIRRSDIVFCHLSYTKKVMHLCKMLNKPVFHVTHSSIPVELIKKEIVPVNIIYNSETAKKELSYNYPSIVVHPIVRNFNVEKPIGNKFITLINLNENKGARVFYEIAKALPTHRFLAVKGTYNEQIIEPLPNVTFLEPTPDIEAVYRQTRILLMPSAQESWGMTAAEAMKCGIPVICTKTDGLYENCKDAAIYCERGNIQQWANEIIKLDTKKTYLRASESVKLQSRAIDPEKELSQLEIFIQKAANDRNLIHRY